MYQCPVIEYWHWSSGVEVVPSLPAGNVCKSKKDWSWVGDFHASSRCFELLSVLWLGGSDSRKDTPRVKKNCSSCPQALSFHGPGWVWSDVGGERWFNKDLSCVYGCDVVPEVILLWFYWCLQQHLSLLHSRTSGTCRPQWAKPNTGRWSSSIIHCLSSFSEFITCHKSLVGW